MHDALTLLNELDQEHVEWVFNTGMPKLFPPDTSLIREGVEPDALYIVMEGLVGVYVASIGDRCVAKLGPGELLGDISFLEGIPASASVVAVENTNVLVIPRDALVTKLMEDSEFAARLFRAFAVISSRRLRTRERAFGRILQEKDSSVPASSSGWQRISETIDEFKTLVQEADIEALRNENVVPLKAAKRVEAGFYRLSAVAHEVINDESPGNIHVADDMGTTFQRELLPYLLLSRTAERIYAKPRGMAGDFLITKWICKNRPDGMGRVGPLIDKCFLGTPMLKAVRNQRKIIVREILGAVEEKRGSSLRVTCLGCGPAEEIFDVFMELPDPSTLCVTLIDVDFQALAAVSERLDKGKFGDYVKIHNANLVYLATNREKIDVGAQDLVYSTGMTNYFDDKIVLSLMNYVHTLLCPGGRVLLGNFHTGNPNRVFMKYVLNWHIYHRTEDDMHRLFLSSSFKRECTDTVFEDEGIILFAGCNR